MLFIIGANEIMYCQEIVVMEQGPQSDQQYVKEWFIKSGARSQADIVRYKITRNLKSNSTDSQLKNL